MPEYLTKRKSVETWNILDPEGKDDDHFVNIISQLKAHIKNVSFPPFFEWWRSGMLSMLK